MGYENRLVDDCIDEMCLQASRVYFYPTRIEKLVGLPLEDVFGRLIHLVEDDTLILKWELRCPKYNCADTVRTLDTLPAQMGECATCDYGHEFTIDTSVIFPIFRIHPEYRNFIREKGKKKHLI